MLIGGDDISNDVHTLSTRFSMFVYLRTCFCFALIGGKLTAPSMGTATGGLEVEFKLLFPPPLPEHTGELARRQRKIIIKNVK